MVGVVRHSLLPVAVGVDGAAVHAALDATHPCRRCVLLTWLRQILLLDWLIPTLVYAPEDGRFGSDTLSRRSILGVAWGLLHPGEQVEQDVDLLPEIVKARLRASCGLRVVLACRVEG